MSELRILSPGAASSFWQAAQSAALSSAAGAATSATGAAASAAAASAAAASAAAAAAEASADAAATASAITGAGGGAYLQTLPTIAADVDADRVAADAHRVAAQAAATGVIRAGRTERVHPFIAATGGLTATAGVETAMVDIRLSGTRGTGTVTLETAERNTAGVWRFFVYRGGTAPANLIAQFQTAASPESATAGAVTTHALTQANASGVTGTIAVRWEAMTAGAAGTGLGLVLAETVWSSTYSGYLATQEAYAAALLAGPAAAVEPRTADVRRAHPFTPDATFSVADTKNRLLRTVVDLRLRGTTAGRTYAVAALSRGASGIWYVYVFDDAGTFVASYSSGSSPEAGDAVTLHTLSPRPGQTVSGTVAVRWSEWASGIAVSGMTAMTLAPSVLDFSYPGVIAEVSAARESEAAQVLMPATIYAVEGVESSVYPQAAVLSPRMPGALDVRVTGSKGRLLTERWTITPAAADAGTSALTIGTYAGDALTASRTTSLIIRTASPGVTRKLLAIGDSTTVAGRWLAEVVRLSLAGGGSVTTAGRLSVSAPDFGGTSRTVKHEAVSGQDVNYFYSNVASPFVFSGVFDFAQYLTANPTVTLASGDWVTIHLGINDWLGFTSDAAVLASTAVPDRITKLEAMIQSIRSAVPGIRVGVMLTIPPATSQDAWGDDYSLIQHARRYRRNRDLWVRALLLAFDARTADGIYVAPTHACLDADHGYPVGASAARNAYDTTLVARSNNAVHPADSGYWQLGAAVYALLRGVEG